MIEACVVAIEGVGTEDGAPLYEIPTVSRCCIGWDKLWRCTPGGRLYNPGANPLVGKNRAKYPPSTRVVVLFLECVAALMTILQHVVLVVLTYTDFLFANHGPNPVE